MTYYDDKYSTFEVSREFEFQNAWGFVLMIGVRRRVVWLYLWTITLCQYSSGFLHCLFENLLDFFPSNFVVFPIQLILVESCRHFL